MGWDETMEFETVAPTSSMTLFAICYPHKLRKLLKQTVTQTTPPRERFILGIGAGEAENIMENNLCYGVVMYNAGRIRWRRV